MDNVAPLTVQQVVQFLAEAPRFGKVIISFEDFQPTHLEIRSSIRLTGGAKPAPAQ